MVVTRSGTSSPASGADTESVDTTLRRPASDAAPVQGTLGDVGASRASMVDAPLLMPSAAPGESVAPGGSATPGGVAAPGWSAVPGGSAAAGASAHDAATAPVVMSTDQLLLLINRLSHGDTVSTTAHTYTGNFAKCTARFDGDKSSNVQAFIDSVLTYKDCVGVNDDIALRGLSMLLTGLAATWWQGVKDSTPTWQNAMEALKQTFGPRSPPHKIYRCIFEREQRVDESTDLFVCHLRALFSQLPPFTLSETVQLDMCYGLLHRRIREKVPRTSFNDFGDLLTQARRAEDILEESRARTSTESKPAVTTYSTVAKPSSPAASSSNSHKVRSYCNYCRQYGHVKDDCPRLVNRVKKYSKEGEGELRATTSTVTCFGCGAPGVIRSSCPICNSKENAPTNNNVNAFQSISASVDNFDSRVRPVLNIKINGAVGKVLLDTGAKHSVGSVSLRAHLVKTGHKFTNIFAEFKYADGRVVAQSVEVANVKITVRNVNIKVAFVMLPNATESLLGMNFIKDAGMVLDFKRNIWFMERDKTPQPIKFESKQQVLSCSSVMGLREDKGAYLNADDRRKLYHLPNEDTFRPGGGPTDYGIHRIDTGDAAPIACPPYRVTPAKEEIIKKEIERSWGEKNQETGHSTAYLTFARERRSPISVYPNIQRIVAEQDIRKSQGDLQRREAPPYKEGDLVLVETHMASNASKGFTSKFAPKREGPYRISEAIGPTSFLIIDNTGQVKGNYHTSALTPYSGEMNVVRHPRCRGRQSKPQTRRSCGLEGEVVAHRSNEPNTPAPTLPIRRRERRARRPPRRLLE